MERSYYEFKQRVRRYRPSEVLSATAAASIENESTRNGQAGPPLFHDFALAGIAKASVYYGNEHRHSGVTRLDLRAMCSAFIAVRDPFLDDNLVDSFSVRMAFEQFPYQVTPFNDMARTKALLVDAADEADQEVITPTFWSSVLGCTVEEFVGLALFLHTAALNNRGRFDPDWLSQPNFDPVYRLLPRDIIENVSRTHFIITKDRFREISDEHALDDPSLKRYEFNPLLAGPFVELPGHRPTAPVLHPIWYRATPGGLYYIGVGAHGTRFTNALGAVFEKYVEKQLTLCEPENLIPEIVYDKEEKRSVDYIMVMPKAVMLVEAKATPLSEGGRLGTSRLKADFDRAPGKGVKQVARTAELIRNRHPSFSSVPRDRPILGLVVTMEPYHHVANDLVFSNHDHAVPTWLCSVRELEHLVSLRDASCDDVLLGIQNEGGRNIWSLSTVLPRYKAGCNAILDEAWAACPFSSDSSTASPPMG